MKDKYLYYDFPHPLWVLIWWVGGSYFFCINIQLMYLKRHRYSQNILVAFKIKLLSCPANIGLWLFYSPRKFNNVYFFTDENFNKKLFDEILFCRMGHILIKAPKEHCLLFERRRWMETPRKYFSVVLKFVFFMNLEWRGIGKMVFQIWFIFWYVAYYEIVCHSVQVGYQVSIV